MSTETPTAVAALVDNHLRFLAFVERRVGDRAEAEEILQPAYEEILRRVDLGGMRPVDFAAEAGISPNNAMVRLHRARKALRARLAEACGTCAEHGCLDCRCGRGAGCRPDGA
jgi:DNA-directed RNA polymerase specialized sigma24 family protein